MILGKHNKIEKLIDKKKSYSMSAGAYLDVDKRTIKVTDGNALARVPVEVHAEDTSGYVTIDAITTARKLNSPILCNGALETRGMVLPRPEFKDYPPVDALIDSIKGEPVVTVGIDVDLLHRLAQALGANNLATGPKSQQIVKLEIRGSLDLIKVTLPDDDESVGIIAPCRV